VKEIAMPDVEFCGTRPHFGPRPIWWGGLGGPIVLPGIVAQGGVLVAR
jgi:hypothetical protein